MEFYLSYICCGDLGVKKAKLSRILKNSGSSVLSGLNCWENAKIAKPVFQNYENF
jgi:hypothetical protein